ncbi:MAG TPA: glycosyltransferase family 9 protein [Verrucomicrobiae bacterium]|nr:glycosyltransferase family 9 protein [Verrucomicrobiae bacterium]
MPFVEKQKLLVLELWGVGDLAIATPFLRASAERFEVTLLAKPHALELQPRFWPEVRVIPFVAPWTAFRGKYHLWNWPWVEMFRLRQQFRQENFNFSLSARPDPRDHWLLKFLGAQNRLGFPHLGSGIFLTDSLPDLDSKTHRYEFWREAGKPLDIELPTRDQLKLPASRANKPVLIHSGAGQSVRVWPLENYRKLAGHLRENRHQVRIACDSNQRDWWLQAGESQVATPKTMTELFALLDDAGAFIGNDSGPGHIAALCGVPTFTIFGPQLPELFLPLHPSARWIEGKPCPYKPCKDYCRFPVANCLWNLAEAEVWPRVESFIIQNRLS